MFVFYAVFELTRCDWSTIMNGTWVHEVHIHRRIQK